MCPSPETNEQGNRRGAAEEEKRPAAAGGAKGIVLKGLSVRTDGETVMSIAPVEVSSSPSNFQALTIVTVEPRLDVSDLGFVDSGVYAWNDKSFDLAAVDDGKSNPTTTSATNRPPPSPPKRRRPPLRNHHHHPLLHHSLPLPHLFSPLAPSSSTATPTPSSLSSPSSAATTTTATTITLIGEMMRVRGEIGRQTGHAAKKVAPGKLDWEPELGVLVGSRVTSGAFGFAGYVRVRGCDVDVDAEDGVVAKVCSKSGDVGLADMRMFGDDPWVYLEDSDKGLKAGGVSGGDGVVCCWKKQAFRCGFCSVSIGGIMWIRVEDAERGLITKIEGSGGGNRLFVARENVEGIEVWESSRVSGAVSALLFVARETAEGVAALRALDVQLVKAENGSKSILLCMTTEKHLQCEELQVHDDAGKPIK
ncbi:ENDOPLASMIC RETICULUM-ARRESTED PEN3-like protein [Drosera capensis]